MKLVKKIFYSCVLGFNIGNYAFLFWQYFLQYFVGHGRIILVDNTPVLLVEFVTMPIMLVGNIYLALMFKNKFGGSKEVE